MVPEGPEHKRIGDALQLHAGWTITNPEILPGLYRTGEPSKGLAAFADQLLPAVIERVATKRKLIDLVCASECGRRRGSIWARVTRNEGAQASRAPTDAGHD